VRRSGGVFNVGDNEANGNYRLVVDYCFLSFDIVFLHLCVSFCYWDYFNDLAHGENGKMKKIIDYVVLYELDEEALTKQVIDLSCDGYELVGGICASYDHDKNIQNEWLYQAMVKYEDSQ